MNEKRKITATILVFIYSLDFQENSYSVKITNVKDKC